MRRSRFYTISRIVLSIILALYCILAIVTISNIRAMYDRCANVSADTRKADTGYSYDEEFYKSYLENLDKMGMYLDNSFNSELLEQNNSDYINLDDVGVVSTAVRVRTQPTTDAISKGILFPDEEVHITQKSGNWYFIETSSIFGWAYADYIDLKK